MRFIGAKSLIMPQILEIIQNRTRGVRDVGDLFSGSGLVTRELKKAGYNTISNDLMYFSYVLLRGTTQLSCQPRFNSLPIDDPISYLNSLSPGKIEVEEEKCFILNNYSNKGGRFYFTEENAVRIDIIRQEIEKWKNQEKIDDNEYYYLLACLIESVPFISNTTGVYGAFLKYWDKRALRSLTLEHLPVIEANTRNIAYNVNTNDLIKNIESDLFYYDPPYNQRQYLPNYHILETIAKYDNPEVKGVTGLREYSTQKSDYCKKNSVFNSFNQLIKDSNSKYIIMSYNTEGLLSHEQIMDVLSTYSKYGKAECTHIDYLRYKNNKTKTNNDLKELLYFMEKK